MQTTTTDSADVGPSRRVDAEEHPGLTRLLDTIASTRATMGNTLIRSELMARERRFTGEPLPGFGRPQR